MDANLLAFQILLLSLLAMLTIKFTETSKTTWLRSRGIGLGITWNEMKYDERNNFSPKKKGEDDGDRADVKTEVYFRTKPDVGFAGPRPASPPPSSKGLRGKSSSIISTTAATTTSHAPMTTTTQAPMTSTTTANYKPVTTQTITGLPASATITPTPLPLTSTQMNQNDDDYADEEEEPGIYFGINPIRWAGLRPKQMETTTLETTSSSFHEDSSTSTTPGKTEKSSLNGTDDNYSSTVTTIMTTTDKHVEVKVVEQPVDDYDDEENGEINGSTTTVRMIVSTTEELFKDYDNLTTSSTTVSPLNENQIEKEIYFALNPVRYVGVRYRQGNVTFIPNGTNNISDGNVNSTKTEDIIPCKLYEGNPKGCKIQPNCYFRCNDETCQRKPVKEISGSSITKELCSSHEQCTDKCGCKSRGCQYSTGNGNCWSFNSECTEFSFKADECARANKFYSFGGSLCKNLIDRGNCQVTKTIFTVNLNGENIMDQSKIYFLSEDYSMYNDPFNLNRRTQLHKVDENIRVAGSLELSNHKLYSTYIWGRQLKRQNTTKQICLTFPNRICEDGRYELNIKTVETFWENNSSRSFSVFLNDLPVLLEVDIYQLLGSRYQAIDLVVNFNISEGGHSLHWNGKPPSSPILNQFVNVSFCYGECSVPDPSFVISAFSILKLIDLQEHPLQEDHANCTQYRGDKCNCSRHGCAYRELFGDCLLGGILHCSKCDFRQNVCLQRNAYYSSGGLLCKAMHDSDCPDVKFETVWAVNLNGPAFVSSKGIRYHDDLLITKWGYVSDPLGSLKHEKNVDCKIIDNVIGQDRKLYDSYVAIGVNKDDKNCVSYTIPMCKNDGSFELRIDVMSYPRNDSKEAFYDIRLNNLTILSSFNSLKATEGEICYGNEVIVPFIVKRGRDNVVKLYVDGYPTPSIVKNEEILLSFCGSFNGHQCVSSSGFFEMSAFSIIRFVESHQHEDNNFSNKIEKIVELGNQRCGGFSDICKCKDARCEFNSFTNVCSYKGRRMCGHCNMDPSECRRGNTFYVVGPGRFCRTVTASGISKGNCIASKVIVTKSLNGNGPFTDGKGVPFVVEEGNNGTVKMEGDRNSSLQKHSSLKKGNKTLKEGEEKKEAILLPLPQPDPKKFMRSEPPFYVPFDHPQNKFDTRRLHERAKALNMSFYEYFVRGVKNDDVMRLEKKYDQQEFLDDQNQKDFGEEEVKINSNCIEYRIPLHLIGSYELCVKVNVGQEKNTDQGQSYYSMYFNGIPIIEELNPFDFTSVGAEFEEGERENIMGEMGEQYDICVNFGIDEDGLLHLSRGYAVVPIVNRTVGLVFCKGSCGDGRREKEKGFLGNGDDADEPISIYSGFSVVKFEDFI